MFGKSLSTLFSTTKQALTNRIVSQFSPVRFQIEDESHYHTRGKETHFKMLVVSEKFSGLNKIQKQKLVYSTLGSLMKQIHALTLTCQTPQQNQNNSPNESPGCIHKK